MPLTESIISFKQ